MTEEELLRCLRDLRRFFDKYIQHLDEREARLKQITGGSQ